MNESSPSLEQVQQAATGDLEAFADLVLATGPGMRVWLGSLVESFATIARLELEIWIAARHQLDDYDGTQPFSEWLQALARERVIKHLKRVQQAALATLDLITGRLAQDALTVLVDGSDGNIAKLSSLRAALPEAARMLLVARYRDRLSLSVIATRQSSDERAVANALVTARAHCDWRGIARPPAPDDRDLPPLIEGMLGGIIENASRLQLADYVSRGPEPVQQVASQVRVHVALCALHLQFPRAQAVAIARQALAGNYHARHVAICAPVRSPVIPATASGGSAASGQSPRAMPTMSASSPAASAPVTSSISRVATGSPKAARTRASAEWQAPSNQPAGKTDGPVERRNKSLVPYLIAGVLVVGGVIGVVLSSRSSATVSSQVPTAGTTMPLPERTEPKPLDVRPTPLPPAVAEKTPSQPPPAKPVSGPVQVMLTGVAAGTHPYAGRDLVLRGALSADAGIVRVEFWNADNKVGEATSAPWTYIWKPPAGALSLTARAVAQSGEITTSAAVTCTVVATYGSGGLRREWWTGIPGDQVKDFDKIDGFPARPQGHALVDQFASPANWADGLVQRIWGYLIPPIDGEYVFWIAADDEAELWLSNDDSVNSRQRIAVSAFILGSGTKLMEWDRQPGQRSAAIRLQAGHRYLIEALHKEGAADDHVEVGWRLPDGTMERPIPGFHLSPPQVADPSPTAPTPAPTPAPVTAPPPITWTVVRAINLGGDTVELDGVRWLGQRQAEAEGATPTNSHQPGPWVSDVPWTRANNGNGQVQRDRSTTNRPLSIDGKVFAKGLGAHSASEIVYALDGQWTGFTALAGVDDAADGAKAEVVFQVWVDGQKAWDSGPVRKGVGKPVAVSLVGRKELRLVVDPSGPNDWDHANWANAQFMRPGGGDGTLQVKSGKRSTASFTPKPAVDAKMRTLLSSGLAGTSKEPLEFQVRVPNGPVRVWLLVGEPGVANSRQFDVQVNGTALPTVTGLPASGWQKLGPVDLFVADEAVTIKATSVKGVPHLMGFLAERPELPNAPPLLSATDPLATIADAVGYRQIYQAELAKMGKEVPYDVDNTATFSGGFKRVAYLLELQIADQPLQWVWTSMDAFTTEVRRIGVPTASSGAFFQQTVANLVVASNVAGVPVGTVGDGVIEFWSPNYGGQNQAGIPGATDAFDFGDQPNAKQGEGYGSMQVHNLGAKQTVWALNHWVVGAKADVGIGPSPSNGDWTFAANADRFALKRLRIFVKSAP